MCMPRSSDQAKDRRSHSPDPPTRGDGASDTLPNLVGIGQALTERLPELQLGVARDSMD